MAELENAIKILWVDDEIELLKAHILFLEKKGYTIKCLNNGQDAIDICKKETFDIIFLDENMPGLSGLEVLVRIKEIDNSVPVVMITKSEEEDLMNQAIGNKIADYLIKPVNPNQILLSVKKNVHKKTIIDATTVDSYRSAFMEINDMIGRCNTFEDWASLYKKLVYWELELSSSGTNMDEILRSQKSEANSSFTKYVKASYETWLNSQSANRPMMSHDIMRKYIFPMLDNGERIYFIMFDNLRYDQWQMVKKLFKDRFVVEDERLYCTILPTSTQYARNSIFAGLLPSAIKRLMPQYWVEEEEEDGKNLYEEEMLRRLIERSGKTYSMTYNKVVSPSTSKFLPLITKSLDSQLNVFVFSFVDMLSHARTDSKMIRELAFDDASYRSVTYSWFEHSMVMDFFDLIAKQNAKVVITTDHGTIKIDNAIKVVGEKNTNTNLRYKIGRNLACNSKNLFRVTNPEKIGLPSTAVNTNYLFAEGPDFFAYPNNYNYYVQYYKNTFQHGGISMEEMLVPLVTLKSKE